MVENVVCHTVKKITVLVLVIKMLLFVFNDNITTSFVWSPLSWENIPLYNPLQMVQANHNILKIPLLLGVGWDGGIFY